MSCELLPEYNYLFAKNDGHEPIRSIRQLKAADWATSLGLFYKGVFVGSAELRVISVSKKHLHTENVFLREGYKRKGHGLQLYLALIDCAKSLGADRLYSSKNLRMRSRRMWATKLQERTGIEVHHENVCKHPCKHCRARTRHYIDLRCISTSTLRRFL